MNTIEFHKTTTKELLAIKDRVRNLISHWGEDGNYQEAVLKNIIRRFLPENYNVATGFVIKQTEERGIHAASKQIDIIVYKKDFPVMFKEGDFVIVTADAVEAIIEVKANLKNQSPEKVFRKANEIGQFIYNAKYKKDKQFFNGIFSYEGYGKLTLANSAALKTILDNSENTIANDANSHMFKVNHVSFNKNMFYKFWVQNGNVDGSFLYETTDLAFSFLISNLISHLSYDSVQNNNKLWFPVDKSFNSKRL